MNNRHFKKKECERSLLKIGSTLTGKPWREDWKSFLPEQYRHKVFSKSDPAEESKNEQVPAEEDKDGEVLSDDEFDFEEE